jgi:hypothetical protein
MVKVHHARHAIKSEAIKPVLFHPKAEVAHKESEYLVRAVVEEARVPELMAAPAALVEVAMVRAVEKVQAIEHILTRVRMYNVEQYGDSHAVCGVDEFFELIWRAVARARGEEARYLVPKRWRAHQCGAMPVERRVQA